MCVRFSLSQSEKRASMLSLMMSFIRTPVKFDLQAPPAHPMSQGWAARQGGRSVQARSGASRRDAGATA